MRLTDFFKTEVLTGDHPPGSARATPITFPKKTLLSELTDTYWVDEARVVD